MSNSTAAGTSEVIFHEKEPGHFVRRLFASEAIMSASSDLGGAMHCTFSAGVTFTNLISTQDLIKHTRRAAVRLRHLVPSIACKTSRRPTCEYDLSYEVPKSSSEAYAWASEVIQFYGDRRTLSEHNAKVAEERWWKASDNRYSIEFHVAPDTARDPSWLFSMSAHHNNIDARTSYMLIEALFQFVSDEIHHRAPSLESLAWGEETRRLTLPPHFIWSLEETGIPEPLPEFQGMPTPPKGYVPWLYSVQGLDGSIGKLSDGDINFDFVLSKKETARLHEVCKKHGRTVTKTVDALLILAHAESSLRIAGNTSNERFREVSSSMQAASHIFKGMNVPCIRSKLPEAYQTFGPDHCTPLLGNDALLLSFPIEPYKKMVKPDLDNLTATHVANKATFWDEIVRDIADAWDNEDTSPTGFRARGAMLHALSMTKEVDLSIILNTGPSSSSFGDYTRLNILEPFRPSNNHPTLTVYDIDCNVRWLVPSFGGLLYQYDDRFRMKLNMGRLYETEGDMQLRARILRRWFDEIIMSDDL